jgi:hypothetical protein
MFSRHALHEFAQQHFHIEAFPLLEQTDILTGIQAVLSEHDMSKSELCKNVFTDRGLQALARLPQHIIANFFGVSAGLVSRCKSLAKAGARTRGSAEGGRPTRLSPAAEQAIMEWMQTQCLAHDWPALRDFKEQVIAHFEEADSTTIPSQSYYTRLLDRLMSSEFQVRKAQPLEEARFDVRPEIIQSHFKNLADLDLTSISPHVILNLDETGFRASKSGRAKARKVIVPKAFAGTPVFKDRIDSHFVTTLCAISAAGDVLMPGLFTKRENDHSDAEECSYVACVRRYSSCKAFVTRDFLRVISLIFSRQISRIGANLWDRTHGQFCSLMVTWLISARSLKHGPLNTGSHSMHFPHRPPTSCSHWTKGSSGV